MCEMPHNSQQNTMFKGLMKRKGAEKAGDKQKVREGKGRTRQEKGRT